ncbi:uroporphyrinogen-III synthase [Campylobacter hyointestinalis]|nr:uroporphyrinogen III synthase [Campylobacter hyointestinalis subsp. lawsonii]
MQIYPFKPIFDKSSKILIPGSFSSLRSHLDGFYSCLKKSSWSEAMIYLVSNTIFNDDEIINLKVCEVVFKKFSVDLDDFDVLVLTSKNGINALKFNDISPRNLIVKSIGEATTKSALDFGFSDVTQALSSHGKEFGMEIVNDLKNKKVLYISAKETMSNLSFFLKKNSVDITTIIGYENVILSLDSSLKPPLNSKIIFTSPKNVEGFIRNFGWDSSYKAIAIGKTTAKYLEKFTNAFQSKVQSINECVALAKEIK